MKITLGGIKILNLMIHFANGSIMLAVIIRTIYLLKILFKNIISRFKDRDEEWEYYDEDEEDGDDDDYSGIDEEEDNEFEYDLDRELDNSLGGLKIVFPGLKSWLKDLILWSIEHKFLTIIIGYVFCTVPIVNLFLSIVELKVLLDN